MDSLVRELAEAGFEVINEEISPQRGRITGRVHVQDMDRWRAHMRRLLLAADTHPWAIDISRMYFIPKGETVERYCWRILFTLKDPSLKDTSWVLLVANLLLAGTGLSPVPPPGRVELKEYPLFLNPERNAPNERGKGATSTAGG
jgi:hypothetical protein